MFIHSAQGQDKNLCKGLEQPAQKQKYNSKTRVAGLTHIWKMSQIISQLSRCGLPETQDDRYFMEELGDLVESIRRWARLFSRGRRLLDSEDLTHPQVTERVRGYFKSGFLNISMSVRDLRGKVGTRIAEVIILRTLMGDRLLKRPIGFLESDYENHRNLIQMMDCTGKPHYSNYLYSCLIFL